MKYNLPCNQSPRVGKYQPPGVFLDSSPSSTAVYTTNIQNKMPQDKQLGVQNKVITKKRSNPELDDEHWQCLRCQCPGHLTPVKRIGPDGQRVYSIAIACSR